MSHTLTAHAQRVTITDRHGKQHKMAWDFIAHDGLFADGTGIAIYYELPSGELRLVGMTGKLTERRLSSIGRGDETPDEALAKDFVERFNQETADLFDMPWENGNSHPVNDATFQYILANVAYDPATQKMTVVTQ